jgi:hypothetical protein
MIEFTMDNLVAIVCMLGRSDSIRDQKEEFKTFQFGGKYYIVLLISVLMY